MTILDLGCGTGLGADFYKPFAARLTGVDASPRMLEKAKAKNVFDRLRQVDILSDWDFTKPFDLIYSSDVFVYLGDLVPVMESAFKYLKSGGVLAFSVELITDGDEDYELTSTGRFRHSGRYVQAEALRSGFRIQKLTEAPLREERGVPVNGLLAVLEK